MSTVTRPNCGNCLFCDVPAGVAPCKQCSTRDRDVPSMWKSVEARKRITGGDIIRSMSDEELADWFCFQRDCGRCSYARFCGCKLKEWLSSPIDWKDAITMKREAETPESLVATMIKNLQKFEEALAAKEVSPNEKGSVSSEEGHSRD